MKTRRSFALAGSFELALALAFMLAVAVLSTGSEAAAEASSEGGSAGQAAPSQAGDQAEGIKVHGHWIVEVRDPDGSLVERQEFDNALLQSGSQILTRILGRDQSVGNWTLRTLSQSSPVCENPAGTPIDTCFIAEPGDPFAAAQNHYFETLSVGISGSAPFSLNLSGYLTAQRDGTIESVFSVVNSCGSATAPDACVGAAAPIFEQQSVLTFTNLPSPVAVLTGQQVLVNVVISFS